MEIDPASWVFPSPEHRSRWEAARAALVNRLGAPAPAEKHGAFLVEAWPTTPPTRLGVLHYGGNYPQVFGLTFDGGDDLVQVHVSRDGARIVGHTTHVTVSGPGGPLTLGTPMELRVGEHAVVHVDPAMDGLVSAPSATAFVALAHAGVDGMAGAARDRLHEGTVTACVYGAYAGDGVPPPCTPRPLTPEESAAERQKVDAWAAQAHAAIDVGGLDWAARVRATTPPL